ncbi:hypothetical protein KAW18_10935 [candidate division WOR-3 bacterium]|nr:hypothetical protein [candidate division WOR-3 bacterium]
MIINVVRTRILAVLLVMGVLSAFAGAGTIADFLDTEVSTGNTFETGKWCDGIIKIDVKPGSCPNPINVKSGGNVLQIAILGTVDFPVDDLDPESVRVWWRNDNGDYIGGNVKPIHHSYEDTATPFYPTPGGEDCCHNKTGDGFDDLNVQFNKQALVDDLELDALADKTTIYLRVTVDALDEEGNVVDTLVGGDCVRIQGDCPDLKLGDKDEGFGDPPLGDSVEATWVLSNAMPGDTVTETLSLQNFGDPAHRLEMNCTNDNSEPTDDNEPENEAEDKLLGYDVPTDAGHGIYDIDSEMIITYMTYDGILIIWGEKNDFDPAYVNDIDGDGQISLDDLEHQIITLPPPNDGIWALTMTIKFDEDAGNEYQSDEVKTTFIFVIIEET